MLSLGKDRPGVSQKSVSSSKCHMGEYGLRCGCLRKWEVGGPESPVEATWLIADALTGLIP